MEDFGNRLIEWYRQNKRDLPWRRTNDPYAVWLSEVILQQTRVEQGLSYYLSFLERYPDVKSLAKAPEDEVFKMWQGLGYYNRAANMMHAARTIVKDYQGRFPEDKQELLKIKGIGPYTAAAVSSIAFGRKAAVVDGNVFRVLSRIFSINTPVNTGKAKTQFEALALQLMRHHPPGEFNQALMEFGARFCKPRNPNCPSCIFRAQCDAFNKGKVHAFPVKKPKMPLRNRYFYYLVISYIKAEQHLLLLKKRDGKDIWGNLYDFPLIERSENADPLDVLADPLLTSLLGEGKRKVLNISAEYRQQLTHQRIHAWFIHLVVDKNPNLNGHKSLILVEKNRIQAYPVPKTVDRYLQDEGLIQKQK